MHLRFSGGEGTTLRRQLRSIYTDVSVLLTSGYIDEDIARHDQLASDTPFIQKPFLPAELARRVRQALEHTVE